MGEKGVMGLLVLVMAICSYGTVQHLPAWRDSRRRTEVGGSGPSAVVTEG